MTDPGHSAGAGARRPVAVIMGGPSAEHDVSIVSGTGIAGALAARGHPVRQYVIDLAGTWWLLPAEHRREDRAAAAYDDPRALGAAGPFDACAAATAIAAAGPWGGIAAGLPPVAFVALHGPFGEDGTIQAILEDAGVAYTGSGVAASAIGMDKPLFKRFARAAGLPILDWVEVSAETWSRDRAAALGALERLAADAPGGSLIAKPACLGSSIGTAIAPGRGAWQEIVEGALAHDDRAIVEPCLDRPREIEMGVLGNPATGLVALGPGEVIPGRSFYDYADKYAAGSTARTIATAELAADLAAEVRRLGLATFDLVGATGLARVDFFLDRATGSLVLNEINTIPGFTPISLYPQMAAVAGHPFGELCSHLVELGAAASATRRRRQLRPEELPR